MNLLLLVRSEILDILIMTYLLVYDRYCRKFRQGNDEFRLFAVACLGHAVFALLTEITVNLEGVPVWVNNGCHIIFYAFALLFYHTFFTYVVSLVTDGTRKKWITWITAGISIVTLVIMPVFPIYYLNGHGTKYSMGLGVAICYGVGFLMCIVSDILLLIYRKKIRREIVFALLPITTFAMIAMLLQIVIPEFLFTGSAMTMVAIGVFFAIENPIGKLYKEAMTDRLTKTLNRNAYVEWFNQLAEEINEDRYNKELVYILCDMNNLKGINDEYGHAEGDHMIMEAGKVLRKYLINATNIYRIGGDEFVVIYEGEKAKYALTELEGIPAACERTSQHLIYPLILAMGCAIRMKGENLQDLSKRADDLMYENKQELYRTSGMKRRGMP